MDDDDDDEFEEEDVIVSLCFVLELAFSIQ